MVITRKQFHEIWKNYLKIFNASNYTSQDTNNIKNVSLLHDYDWYFNKLLSLGLNDNLKILDWGCGNGHVSFMLKQIFPNSEVISFSVCPSEDVRKLHKLLNLSCVYSEDKMLLPFENEYFDLIISSGVIEHVTEWGGQESNTILEINRILKVNAYFIAWRIPFAWSVYEYFNYIMNKWHHPRRYTLAELKYLLNFGKIIDYRFDGLGFVRVRMIFNYNKLMNYILRRVENLLGKLKPFHFLLNDIFIIVKKF